jgi:hypothetical protein
MDGQRHPDVATTEALAAHIAAMLDDVTAIVASEEGGAPEVAWGDRFLYREPGGVETARTRPFATIVTGDYPGFDEASDLDRPGVFRLNLSIGRSELATRCPAPAEALDLAALDVVMPHPVYAAQGWACVLNPSPARMAEVDELLTIAHARAAGDS